MERLRDEDKIIECRSYETVYGVWYYFMAKDSQIQLEHYDYVVIGTLASYMKIRDYFGKDRVVPIYIDLEDGERLSRALRREKKQTQPRYYSEKRIKVNQDMRKCAGATSRMQKIFQRKISRGQG